MRSKSGGGMTDALSELAESFSNSSKEVVLGRLARKFSPNGFATFFTLITNLVLPEHHVKAAKAIFDTFTNEEFVGVVIEMFRGSAKTTVWNNAWGAYLIGHFPNKAGMIIQANEDAANLNGSKIASYIESSKGWKVAFPHIVPDTDAGWGAKGYFVKQTHTDASMEVALEYTDWVSMRGSDPQPTLMAVGYNSKSILGKRPHWITMDDMDGEDTSSSDRQAIDLKKKLSETIFPAANRAKIRMVIGTPWSKSDTIHYCLSTGLFRHERIAVYTDDGKITWPGEFTEKRIEQERKLAGEIGFKRQYLLDLDAGQGGTLKEKWLHPYFPNMEIKKDWPAIIFIDYTSTKNPLKMESDFFALAVAQVVPGNRKLVISDGIYERLTRYDAQKLAISKILEYPNLLTVGVEAIFTGDEYHSILEANQELVDAGIIPEACRGGPWQKNKGHRFETVLADAVQRGIVVFSDSETKFFRAFKDEWLGWQGDKLASQGHDDALDAVFGTVHLGLRHLIHGASQKYETNNLFYPQEKKDEYAWVRGMTK